jgi:NAD(P)-dependent dehydrogenase (short-subunit alcohol dehydrogenase family)
MGSERRTAVITGAARGLGRAIAFSFAEAGADLVLADVADDIDGVPYNLGSAGQLDYTAEECRKRGSFVLVSRLDVRDLAAIEEAMGLAVDRYGKIDVLVNNAGIAAPSGKIAHEITEEEWALMIEIDLSGAWRMTKVVGELMVGQRSGSIVNVSSTAGVVGYRHFAAYVSAKHGLVGLTRAVALDYAPYKVRVNAVLPGSVRDDPVYEGVMLSEIVRALEIPQLDAADAMLESQPTHSLVEPGEIANTVVWVALNAPSQLTGAILTVDGGYTVR